MTWKRSEHRIYTGTSKLSSKIYNDFDEIRECSIDQSSPRVHLHVRWWNARSELDLAFVATMLEEMCGTQKLETGWKLKLMSSINIIEMLWELSKMDRLSDTAA